MYDGLWAYRVGQSFTKSQKIQEEGEDPESSIFYRRYDSRFNPIIPNNHISYSLCESSGILHITLFQRAYLEHELTTRDSILVVFLRRDFKNVCPFAYHRTPNSTTKKPRIQNSIPNSDYIKHLSPKYAARIE